MTNGEQSTRSIGVMEMVQLRGSWAVSQCIGFSHQCRGIFQRSRSTNSNSLIMNGGSIQYVIFSFALSVVNAYRSSSPTSCTTANSHSCTVLHLAKQPNSCLLDLIFSSSLSLRAHCDRTILKHLRDTPTPQHIK